ncbi:hypothetical protein H0H87_012932, partial [Tephrocybe sp. NHM501043]
HWTDMLPGHREGLKMVEEGKEDDEDQNWDNSVKKLGSSEEEEEDYGYKDPMKQHIEKDDGDEEWVGNDETDALGPEDGNEGTEGMEDHLRYAEL